MSIKEKIEGFNNSMLQKGTELNTLVSFYTELSSDLTQHPYFPKFKQKLSGLYHNIDKEDLFLKVYLGDFIPTAELSETIFSNLFDVFDSQNQNISVFTKDAEDKELKSSLMPYFEYFKNKGWDAYKTMFNSFLVVDIDEASKPYLYNLAPEFVKYLELDKDDKVIEIIFTFDDEKYYHYTDLFYSVYLKTKEGDFIEKKTSNHKLAQCPANWFIDDKLNSKTVSLRKNIVIPQIDDLHKIVIKTVELYISEFITSNAAKVTPANPCGYAEGNNICKGGKLYSRITDSEGNTPPITKSDGSIALCPKCGHNRHVGSGESYSVNYEKMAELNINIADLIKWFTPPIEGTEYQLRRLNEMKIDVLKSAVGVTTAISAEARNEKDVNSGYENRTKILTAFGEMYAHPMVWAFDIILKIKGSKAKSYVFLGNKFYLVSVDELLAQKESATDPIQRKEIVDQINILTYKHDVTKLAYITKVYEQLPYSGLSDADFIEYVKLNKVSNFDIELRNNINYYIDKFVRKWQNDPDKLDYDFISEEIETFVNEKLANQNIIKDEIITEP